MLQRCGAGADWRRTAPTHSLFSAVPKALPRSELAELGERLDATKKVAPSKPYPRWPSEPPSDGAQDPVAKVAEKVVAVKAKLVERQLENRFSWRRSGLAIRSSPQRAICPAVIVRNAPRWRQLTPHAETDEDQRPRPGAPSPHPPKRDAYRLRPPVASGTCPIRHQAAPVPVDRQSRAGAGQHGQGGE
jgi:hypothetical protein